jgi:hypothetical protein
MKNRKREICTSGSVRDEDGQPPHLLGRRNFLHLAAGAAGAGVLEVQVKRALTFAPADPVFREVVGQIAKATRREDFWTSRYELTIATAKGSRKIDGAYQDVLRWARAVGSAEVFFQRLRRTGSANDDMRALVKTFRTHLKKARQSPGGSEQRTSARCRLHVQAVAAAQRSDCRRTGASISGVMCGVSRPARAF